jgi:hypothetical protein
MEPRVGALVGTYPFHWHIGGDVAPALVR